MGLSGSDGVQVSSSQGWGSICGKSHTAGPGSKAYFSWVETPVFAGKGREVQVTGRPEPGLQEAQQVRGRLGSSTASITSEGTSC